MLDQAFNLLEEHSVSLLLNVKKYNIVSILQEQQGLLHKVIKNQKSLETKTSLLEKKLLDLEKKQISTSPSSSSVGGKRKRIVTSELSVSKVVCNCANMWLIV